VLCIYQFVHSLNIGFLLLDKSFNFCQFNFFIFNRLKIFTVTLLLFLQLLLLGIQFLLQSVSNTVFSLQVCLQICYGNVTLFSNVMNFLIDDTIFPLVELYFLLIFLLLAVDFIRLEFCILDIIHHGRNFLHETVNLVLLCLAGHRINHFIHRYFLLVTLRQPVYLNDAYL